MKFEEFEKCNGRRPFIQGAAPEFKPTIRNPDGHLGATEQSFGRSSYDKDIWDQYADEYGDDCFDACGVPRDHFGFRVPRD